MIQQGMAEPTGRVCTCEACREHPQSTEAREHRKLNRVVSGLNENMRDESLAFSQIGKAMVASLAYRGSPG